MGEEKWFRELDEIITWRNLHMATTVSLCLLRSTGLGLASISREPSSLMDTPLSVDMSSRVPLKMSRCVTAYFWWPFNPMFTPRASSARLRRMSPQKVLLLSWLTGATSLLDMSCVKGWDSEAYREGALGKQGNEWKADFMYIREKKIQIKWEQIKRKDKDYHAHTSLWRIVMRIHKKYHNSCSKDSGV